MIMDSPTLTPSSTSKTYRFTSARRSWTIGNLKKLASGSHRTSPIDGNSPTITAYSMPCSESSTVNRRSILKKVCSSDEEEDMASALNATAKADGSKLLGRRILIKKSINMQLQLLIIISFFSTNLIKNANSVGERGQEPKLYKSFDEIFGKGWDDESNDSKDLNCRHVKEEDQDGQAPNTFDQKNIDEILKQKFDEIYDENWSENENNAAPSPDRDQENSKKHLSDQNNSTDQDESVDEQQNESECDKIKSDQQKWEIIQKFREMKAGYKQKGNSKKEWVQIESKISNNLGVGRSTIYKWSKKLGLKKETKSKFSEFEKREILKQFDEIKSKCKKAKLKNFSKNELDGKIAKKLFVSSSTIFRWKSEFGLSASNKSAATKIGILKKYAKIKRKHPKMRNAVIADMLKISIGSLSNWKKQFEEEIKNL